MTGTLDGDLGRLVTSLIRNSLEDKGDSAVLDVSQLSVDTPLLDSELGLDSLDLATIVVELQERTGFDPFADEFIEFRTIGELIALFKSATPSPRT
jgi:acyl carrier protein